MHKDQSVSEMAVDVLVRQARARASQTGESFEAVLERVLKTEAGGQLGRLRDGQHRDTRASQWQEDLTRKRRRERVQATWEQLMEAERGS